MATIYDGITEDEVTQLVRIYKESERKILSEINGVDIANRTRKQTMLNKIRSILVKLQKPTDTFLEKKTNDEYLQGLKEADELGLFGVINEKSVLAILDSAKSEVASAIGVAYQSIEKATNNLVREAQREAVQETGVALVTGSTRKDLSNKLQAILVKNGITGYQYQDKNGKTYNVQLAKYVDSLARSALRDSRNTAVIQRSIENENDLVKFSSHPKASKICSPWQGRVVSISGNNPSYPTLKEAQTWYKGKIGITNHRYCRHSVIPYVESNIKFN